MADNFEDTENDEFETDGDNAEDGPKALRKAYNKQKAQNEALAQELATLKAEKRERDLAATLSEKGLNAKVAKFIPADADLDEWLTEYGDVFGATPQPQEQQAQQPVAQAPRAPHPLQNQFANLSQVEQGAQAPGGTFNDAAAQQALAEGGLEGYENYIRSLPGTSR